MLASIRGVASGLALGSVTRPRLFGRARPANIVQPCAGVPRPAVSGLGTENSAWQNSRSGFVSAASDFQYSVASLPLLRGATGSRYSQMQPNDT